MKTRLRFLTTTCLILILLGCYSEVKATHAMGADLTYECLGANQYRLTLKLYRDCNGVQAPNFVNLGAIGCNVTAGLGLQSSQVVTPVCPNGPDACSGTGPYGVEEYIYSGVVTLPGGCNNVRFGYGLCCRNDAIATLNGPGSQSMYVETLINRQAPFAPNCNSSPVFNNIPTPYTCVGQPVSFNHGVTDPEGDVLVFSLANCKETAGGNVNYAGGFNGANPLSTSGGVAIDPATGTITFTPTAIQVAVICVRVEEYRNGTKIGETVRDMQFNVLNCSNFLPLSSGIDGTVDGGGPSGSFTTTVCSGEFVCFDIATFDQNNDILNVTWNNGIPGADFTVSNQNTTNPTANFCWVTGIDDVGSSFFTITIQDDNCPLSGSATYDYEVIVLGNSNPPVVASGAATICPGESVPLSADLGGSLSVSSIEWAPGASLNLTNSTSVIATPTQTTVYGIVVVYTNGCSSQDVVEVTVDVAPAITLNSTYIATCPGQTVTLISTGALAPADLASIEWTEDPFGAATSLGAGTVNGTTSSLDVTPAAVTEYIVTYTNTTGCSSTASVLVDVSSPPPLDACNLIYVDDVNSTTVGTQANPTGLLDAISKSLCNNTVIRMATGTYDIDNAIDIPSFVTIEGGFEVAFGWFKTSAPGATTINRTTANVEDEFLANPRIVAMYGSFATGFRLQDLTITTDDAIDATTVGGNPVATYGLNLDNCADYEIIRTQILPGHGENVLGGGTGGNSFGMLLTNSATGTISQSRIIAGAGGTGGTAGSSINISGASPSYLAFDLAGQPIIRAEDISCTFKDVDFLASSSATWGFGTNSNPNTITGNNVTVQFTTIDRHDVSFGAFNYEGFYYAGFDGELVPQIATTASQVTNTVDSFYVCQGDLATFSTSQLANSYNWAFNGAIANPPTTDDVVNGTFNTSGEFWVELYVTTPCCGDSPIDSVMLFVDPVMDYSVSTENISLCNGEVTTLTLDQSLANISIDSVLWSPTTNLNVVDILNADIAPTVDITYTATLYSQLSSGEYVCGDQIEFVVNMNDIPDVTVFITDEITCDDGSINVFPPAGPGPFSYDWSHDPGETGSSLTNLSGALYTVTVTDVPSGCFTVEEMEVELGLFAAFIYFTDISNVNCPLDANGAVTANLNNGVTPVYSWSNSAITPTINGLDPGIYTITITDGNGCVSEEEVEIFSPTPIILSGVVSDASCGTDGAVTLDFPTGGIPQYLYNWSNTSTDMSISGLATGTYTVIVTDDNGCTNSESYDVNLDAVPDAAFIRP
jgi:hypothetical protein